MGHYDQIGPAVLRVFTSACVLACAASCGGQDSSTPSNTPSASLAETLLSAHNQVRDAVTQPAGYSGTWTPLPALTWSSALEASAQTWANSLRDSAGCAVGHQEGDYGENVAGGTVGYSATDAFNAWAVEKSAYVYNPVYTFDNNTGHYTQIVWRSTAQVGCAMSQCSTGYVVYVCRYYPAGNVVNGKPY